MKDLLKSIQKQIDLVVDEDVETQREILEPLFNQVYEKAKCNEIDMKSMLKLSQLENQLSKRILDVIPRIEPSTNIDTDKKIIEQIIYYSRKKMESTYNCLVQKDSLRSRSLDMCNIVLEIAKNLGVAACMFNIGAYFNIPFKHNIVIAYANGYYLIDLTYQQFFLLGYNFENRYYEHPSYTRVCEVGGRMLKNRETALKMIENGYLDNNIEFKKYFDAFLEQSNLEPLNNGYEYLKILILSLKGSSDSCDRILYSKFDFKE